MVTSRHTRDEGFSLTELIVVVALMGLLITVTYAALRAIQASTEVSDRQATFALEVGSPLLGIEEVIQQAFAIESASAYSVTLLTDQDNNNLVERHVISANTDGTLTHRSWYTNSAMQNTTVKMDVTWSQNNVNRSQAEPLFYFYDEDDARINDMAQVSANLRTCDIVIVAEVDGRRIRGTRTAVLRNR